MKKTDKKIHNQIIKALNLVCEIAKYEIDGFEWVSHTVNYQAFPHSLRIICHFKSVQHIQCLDEGCDNKLRLLIQNSLEAENILLSNVSRQIDFDGVVE